MRVTGLETCYISFVIFHLAHGWLFLTEVTLFCVLWLLFHSFVVTQIGLYSEEGTRCFQQLADIPVVGEQSELVSHFCFRIRIFRRWKLYAFNILELALAGVAQWIECWPANQRVDCLILGQGTCLGCGPGPWLGVCER